MTGANLVLQITESDGFGGSSEDGKSISIEMTGSNGREVELQIPTNLAEVIVAAMSSLIAQAHSIACRIRSRAGRIWRR